MGDSWTESPFFIFPYIGGMKIGRTLVMMEFGSHIYGTNTPTSDHDFKAIFVPTARDILLQRAGVTSFQKNTKTNPTAKSTSNDIDMEYLTLTGFLRLCAEGQTMALDMLFTPESFWKTVTPEWYEIIWNRDKLIHRGASAFVGYARQQAAKYGLKGGYVAALRAVCDLLKQFEPYDRLIKHVPEIQHLVANTENTAIIQIIHPNTGIAYDYLQVRNCKVEFNTTAKYALNIFNTLLERYGERARAAETNQGVDFKACMHAVRVCGQAIELLTTGHITLPRPEREMLLRIRKGEIPYKRVANLIEEGLVNLETAKVHSHLPDQVDLDAWHEWASSIYARHIFEEHAGKMNPPAVD